MSLFLENTNTLDNYINISNKIQNIPLFFIHFLPIRSVKSMDSHYRTVETVVQPDGDGHGDGHGDGGYDRIKYKIIDYGTHICSDDLSVTMFYKNNFAPSLYHIFYSASILHQHSISFVLTNCPFVTYQCNLPLLHDFSRSFYFPDINLHCNNFNAEDTKYLNYLKKYFPKEIISKTDTDQVTPFDVFIISYLLHHDIHQIDETEINTITNEYTKGREILDAISVKNNLSYFRGHSIFNVIKYLLQCKYSWTFYSLCYYFILHHSEMLKHFSLHELFNCYIHYSFKDRMYKSNMDRNDDTNILSVIHRHLFS